MLNLTVVTRHFSFATRKTENSLKREPEGKARDGRQQKPIVSELSDWPEDLNLMGTRILLKLLLNTAPALMFTMIAH